MVWDANRGDFVKVTRADLVAELLRNVRPVELPQLQREEASNGQGTHNAG